jgi:hypothetical protein
MIDSINKKSKFCEQPIRIGLGSKFSQLMSWAGDQTVDWTASDGLPSSVIAALSLAVSGMGLSHSDIGTEIHIYCRHGGIAQGVIRTDQTR